MTDQRKTRNVETTAQIVCAYVSKNNVPADQVTGLIETVDEALRRLSGENIADETGPLVPAVPIGKSIHEDYLICLECGEKFKTLKRHLMSSYGLTPDAYRRKWSLPSDYPMVAPGYAKKRSEIAKEINLGGPLS